MVKCFAISAVFALWPLLPAAVSAATPDPTPTPLPVQHPDFSSMTFFTGTWSCMEEDDGKWTPHIARVSIGMNGQWMIIEDIAPRADRNRPYAVNYMTHDASIKKWIELSVNDGGGYALASAPGWVGNSMTWSEKDLDGTSSTDVFAKISDTKISNDLTVTDPTGKVSHPPLETCTKTSS